MTLDLSVLGTVVRFAHGVSKRVRVSLHFGIFPRQTIIVLCPAVYLCCADEAVVGFPGADVAEPQGGEQSEATRRAGLHPPRPQSAGAGLREVLLHLHGE